MTWDVAASINTVIRTPDGTVTNVSPDASFRFDILSDALGRAGRVTSKAKLAQHIIRSIVNRRNVGLLNRLRRNELEAVIRASLNDLIVAQRAYVTENTPDIVGWDVFKRDPRIGEFKRLNNIPIERYFEDTDVVPGRLEVYKTGQRTRRAREQVTLLERIEVTPPVSGGGFDISHTSCTVLPTRTSVTFYFPANRTFAEGEIISSIDSVNVREGADPRQVVVSIRITTAQGDPISLTLPVPVRHGLVFI